MASTSASSSAPAPADAAKLGHGSSVEEYNLWKEPIVRLLEDGGLIGMIDGSRPQPPETSVQERKVWNYIDGEMKDFFLYKLSDELLLTLVTTQKSARDVWLELEAMFTQPKPSKGVDAYKRMPLELYKAALKGDWDTTEAILRQDPGLAAARAAPNLDTVLHIAVGTGKAIPYLEKLVEHIYITDASVLELKSINGYTPLYVAATLGNLGAARALVNRCRSSLYIPASDIGGFPVSKAPVSGHRPTVEFFMHETLDSLDTNPYDGYGGVMLLFNLIDWDFIDIALSLIDKYPNLHPPFNFSPSATGRKHLSGRSALKTIASKAAAFASGAQFNFWERPIYNSCIRMEMELPTPNATDIENPSCCTLIPKEFGLCHKLIRNLQTALYHAIMQLVPRAKKIHEKKLKYDQARKLVERLCEQLALLTHHEASMIYMEAMLTATELGIHEVVEVIVETFPLAIWCAKSTTQRYFFHVAVEHRSEKVFNLIYQMSDHKHVLSNITDITGNTILHRVACLAPPHKLNLVSGAALQMQRELQWFKEVEKFVELNERVKPNHDGKTAYMIFTEDHANLKAEGEKWMKDTANSCSIAAALIATVVFAAAITVPGGNADSGYPLFVKSGAFVVFAVSDAVSLFTSSTSLLMFLSILTSRYAEEDFLHALPKRLCVGLFTLFLSILFMMVAFSATIFLVFGEKSAWVLIPVAVLACLPVTSFGLLQFPLLIDVISSTYGDGIFGKQSDRPFH